MSTKNNISKTAFYTNSQKKTTYTDKKTLLSKTKSRSLSNPKSSEETITQFYPAQNFKRRKNK